jgi:hypothetical protein
MKQTLLALYHKIANKNTRVSVLRILIVLLICSTVVPAVAATEPSDLPDGGSEQNSSASTEATDNSIFGLEETRVYVNDVLENGLDQFNNTGTKWVRGPVIVWSEIESVQGTYDWDQMQGAVDELDQIFNLGYTPIVVVRGTPQWAEITGGSSCGPMRSGYYDNFANFIIAAIEEINDQLPGNYIQFWEIWNEPDIDPDEVEEDNWWGGCWGDDDDEFYGGSTYSKMLTVVYDQLKAEDPGLQVLVGGLNLFCDPDNPPEGIDCHPGDFFEGILDDAGGNNFDGVSFHAYDFYSTANGYGKYGNDAWFSTWDTTGPSTTAKAAFLRNLMAEYGVGYKYLMNTETALTCYGPDNECTPETPGDSAELEATKANYLAESYATAIANGLVANIWFDILGTWLKDNGLINYQDLSKLPAYDAYKFISNELDGARLVRVIQDYETDEGTGKPVGVYGFEFKTIHGYHVWMVRSINGESQVIKLPWAPIKVFDVYGDDLYPSQTPPADINLTVEPTYIRMDPGVPRAYLPLMLKEVHRFYNGDFEDESQGWELVDGGLPAELISENPTDPGSGGTDPNIPIGENSVRLGRLGYACEGGVPKDSYAAAKQTFTVPFATGYPDGEVWVEFKYIMYTQDGYNPSSPGTAYDRFKVFVQEIDDTTADLQFQDWANEPADDCNDWRRIPSTRFPRGTTSGWAVKRIDLSQYQGKTVILSFENHNQIDTWYNTVTYIDDVKLLLNP